MRLVIDADLHGAHDLLDGISDRLDDTRDLLELMTVQLDEYEKGLFASRGNGQWAANDPATIALKGSSTVLVDTGNLLDAMTSAMPGSDGESVVLDTSDVPYLKFLRGGTPSRNPAPTPEQSRVSDWAEGVLGFIVEGRT